MFSYPSRDKPVHSHWKTRSRKCYINCSLALIFPLTPARTHLSSFVFPFKSIEDDFLNKHCRSIGKILKDLLWVFFFCYIEGFCASCSSWMERNDIWPWSAFQSKLENRNRSWHLRSRLTEKERFESFAKNTQMWSGGGDGGCDLSGIGVGGVRQHERWNFSTRVCWVSSNFPVTC